MGERKSANRLKNIQKFDLVIRLTFQISGEKMVCSLNVTGKRAVAWPKKKKVTSYLTFYTHINFKESQI